MNELVPNHPTYFAQFCDNTWELLFPQDDLDVGDKEYVQCVENSNDGFTS